MALKRPLAAALAAAGWLLAAGAAHAGSPVFCGRGPELTARQQDRLLQFAARIKQQLDASGSQVALVSRSGLDLDRFNLRYSHAGISLKASANGAWSVRQLYYACDESRPRLYDQGMAGFVLGNDRPDSGFVSLVLLPAEAGAALQAAAQDNPRALSLLAARYSANAYPFSQRYQNCNQWVAELMALAWGPPQPAPPTAENPRATAQQWLRQAGYAPVPVDVGSHALMFAGPFVPWIHLDDHPQEDLYALKLQVSLPTTLEDFVRRQVPGAQRLELCHDGRQVVLRRGWQPLGPGCRAEAGDEVFALD
ncbi:MAG: DUF2145 domain-containing protein [Aquincola sp.]|nr:DUF2145 domain-containing protein [Aquincola sp.]